MRLIILLLISINTYAKQSACEYFFPKQRKLILKNCELEGKKVSVEYFKTKNCQEYGHTQKMDCFIVRTCPKMTNQLSHQAPIITAEQLKQKNPYCERSNSYLILRDEENEVEVQLDCSDDRPSKISLKVAGQSKDCPLHLD